MCAGVGWGMEVVSSRLSVYSTLHLVFHTPPCIPRFRITYKASRARARGDGLVAVWILWEAAIPGLTASHPRPPRRSTAYSTYNPHIPRSNVYSTSSPRIFHVPPRIPRILHPPPYNTRTTVNSTVYSTLRRIFHAPKHIPQISLSELASCSEVPPEHILQSS